jgi:hypothetical protein
MNNDVDDIIRYRDNLKKRNERGAVKYTCEICNKSNIRINNKTNHEKSKIHRILSGALPKGHFLEEHYHCNSCETFIKNKEWNITVHNNSKTHLKKLNLFEK